MSLRLVGEVGSTSVPSRRKRTKAQTGRIHEIATNEIPKDTSGRPGTLDQPKNQQIVVALTLGLFNITAAVNGPRHHRPVIARTVTVETQRHSPVAKEASAAKDVTPVVATAADTTKNKHHKPKVFARLRDNHGNWSARGYAQSGFFFR